MNVVLAPSCLVAGFFAGWLLRTIIIMAQISHSQECMQRKVRYWQDEAALARSDARRLARQLTAITGQPYGTQWPAQDDN